MAKSKSSGGKKSVPQMKPVAKPSPSTVKEVGVTRPIQKPSPSTSKKVGITGPKC